MLFNSIEFVIFLPIVFVLYWYVFGKSSKTQNAFLLFASYVFYAFADYRFLALLAFTTLCTYYSALAINKHKEQGEQKKAKAISAFNIVANLLVLGFFKYYNFFVTSFAALLPGINSDCLMLNIALPLGISYYTFTALSYSIDVYWGKTKATKDFIQVATYISFFPQILAGPIGRSTYLFEQYSNKRIFNYEESVDGLRQILWGLFKKLLVADQCAKYVNYIWADFYQYSSAELITTLILFAFQIYGDFSGYSDIAIGVSKLFGIKFKQNFRFPLFSTNIADFWSRWHISLTSWLKDYVYTPLGGVWSKATIIRNIFIVFILCGLWHGAGWNYVAWGLINALLFIPNVLCFKYKKESVESATEKLRQKSKKIIILILTDLYLLFSLIFFRADSVIHAIEYLNCICNLNSIHTNINDLNLSPVLHLDSVLHPGPILVRVSFIIFMLVNEWINRYDNFGMAIPKIPSRIIRYVFYYLISFLVLFFGSQSQAFVYAQF